MGRFLVCVTLVGGCGLTSLARFDGQRHDDLRTRAAFDLNCAPATLAMTDLKTDHDAVTVAGVQGCGRRATYVYERGVWVLNAADGQPAGPAITEKAGNP
jgi:hypothetical protein